jgi:excisionase family DNA binding protein
MSHADPPASTLPREADDDAVLLPLNEAAALLRVSRSTMKRLLATGAVPAFHVGTHVRVPTAGIEQYLLERRIGAP